MENGLNINTLIFDMGGVIFENGTKNIISKLIKEFGVAPDIAKNIFMGPESWLLRAGKIDSESYWKSIHQEYQSVDSLNDLDLQLMWYNEFRLIDGMKELLIKLEPTYRVGIVSGNVKDRVDFLLSKYNLGHLMHFQAYSFDYGLHKNDPNLYSKVIQEHHIIPQDTLIIDDHQDCLDAAAQTGLKTILFTNINNLYKELSNYGFQSFDT